MIRFAAVLATLLLLAACGDLPRPFEHEGPNPLLDPQPLAGWVTGVRVSAGDGLTDALAEAMADGLRQAEVPASARFGNRWAWTVVGEARVEGASAVISWHLRDPEGHDAAVIEQTAPAMLLTQYEVTPLLAATMPTARRLANALVAIAPNRPEPTATAASQATGVVVREVTGLPDHRGQAIAAAVAEALRRAGVRVDDARPAAQPAPQPAIIVEGRARLGDSVAGRRRLDLTWVVRDKDGKDLGTLDQGDTVAETVLARSWATLARAIGAGGAEGVLEILQRTSHLQ